MKTAVILSGAPGRGKSNFANFLKLLDPAAVIVCADDGFMVNGEYKFDPKRLAEVHAACFRKFCEALENEEKLVIVANTNAILSHRKKYIDKATEMGYEVISLGVEDLGHKNQHGVPNEAVERMAKSLKENFRF